ncbi:MAG: methyltransferase [Thermococcaceae archaeon]|jgi:SAM-dependent methyltransferase|uniref:class I SAM-dependent methyltransferase n=1 Tax=Thermococcus sp. 101 C5 TaxID=2654197 RepID=UPI00074A9EE6|nr:class I SAM-dependent methyltransferase [Thermococcus sp. 101 C5]KUK00171.1 MAG: UbiE/COQ5 methyltransferase [Thermococcales archaeon 44_46]MDK2782679.1 methyltransferase [Thermococcaceae archaeon]MDK2983282.1 methyltransferase [Thermococcaceae archaeon]MDN5321310.1 methyltransferase [Thermococcaceae archaeon]
MFRDCDDGSDAYYKALPATWDATSEIGKKRIMGLKEILRKYLPIKGEKALDIGCGMGISTFALEELGFEVIGIDLREEAIQKAKEIAKERDSKAEFYIMDAKRRAFEEDSFDLVALLGSPLPHFSVYDLDEIVRESYRVLKAKGVIVIEYADNLRGLYRWYRDVFVEGSLVSIREGIDFIKGRERRFFIDLTGGLYLPLSSTSGHRGFLNSSCERRVLK